MEQAPHSPTASRRHRRALRRVKRAEDLIQRRAKKHGARDAAKRLRASVDPAAGFQPARTGDELLSFFRSSPLLGESLSFDRDRSRGRVIDV